MKRLFGLIVLCLAMLPTPAQSWQELYDKTNDCWGTDWQGCSEILQEAVIVAKEEFGEMNENYVLTVGDLGACYCMMGQYSRALPLLQDALEMTENIVGKDDESYGTRLSNLGTLYRSMGQYEAALPLFQEALINAEKNDGKDHPDYGIRLNNLGILYVKLGQYEKALTHLEASLRNTELNSGKEDYDYGHRIGNLGALYWQLGQYEKALPLLKESLQNAERNLGKQHEEYGIRLNNIGNLYRDMGRYEEALPLLEESLENSENNLGKQHPKYGQSLNNLGDLYRDMGQYEQALPFLQEALTCTKNSLGKQHEQYGNRLHNLAELYEDREEYDIALPYIVELLAVLSSQLSSQFDALNDRIQRSFLLTKTHQFDHISSFRFAHPEYENLQATGFDQQLLIKGFLQNQQIDLLQSLRAHPDTNIQQQYTEWELLHRQLAQEYQKPITDRLSSFEQLENRADDLEIKLANQSLTFRKVRNQVRWQEVQAQLSEGEMAIEFAHFPFYRKGKQTDSIMYVAFVLRSGDAQPHMISLFEEKEVDSQLVSKNRQQLLDRLYTFRGIKPRSAPLSYLRLEELIWKPLDSLLVGMKRIYYSPSGLLNRINLGAIPIEKKKLFSDKYELVQLGSTRSLVFEQESDHSFSKNRALLLGGIRYDTESSPEINAPVDRNKKDEVGVEKLINASRGSLDTWKYLEGTLGEVQTIQHLLAEANYETHLIMGADATEKKLKEQAYSPRILHIATHGYFFPDPKDTTEREKLNTDNLSPIQQSEHPMVRSGLILAGANHAWAGNPVLEGQEDGILTAYEISRMDLSNTELVVLSACETGLGDIQGNEGVYGLQRAFKIAGAKYVMMSLWQVPDKATQELMTAFYEKWLGGMEIRAALQGAQQKLRKKYKKPYYWAGFVLVE